jgi:mannosyltransferase
MSTRLALDKHRFAVMALLVGIFFLGLGLRLYDLDGDSLWYDEVFTSVMAQRDLPSALAIIASGGGATNANQMPLMYIVTHSFILLLGNSDFIVRLQAMLFGSLSILLAYKLGEILWARSEGLMGALLLAVNPYHVRYSQEARHYALMVFLALLSLVFLLKALEEKDKRLWIGFVLCTSLSLYNHYFAFLFLPAEVIFGTVVIVRNRLWRRRLEDPPSSVREQGALSGLAKRALMFYGSLALVGATYVPWLAALQLAISKQQLGPQMTNAAPASLQSSLSFLSGLLADYVGAEGGILLLWVVLFLLGLAKSGSQRALLAALWVAIPLAFPLLVRTQQQFNPRYLIFIVPVFLLTVGRGVVFGAQWLAARLGGSEGRRKWPRQLGFVLAALVFGILSAAPLRGYYLMHKQDYRGAARYLRDHMAAGDIILADSLNPHRGGANQVTLSLGYYLDSYGITQAPILPIEKGLWSELEDSEYRDGQVWAALFYPRPLTATETVEVVDFYHVPLVRLVQPSGDVLDDTMSMLQTLPELLRRPGACFDVYLALAEAYLDAGDSEQAVQQLYQASLVVPDDPIASADLAEVRGRLAQLSPPAYLDIQTPMWRNLGESVALLGYDIHQNSVESGDTLGLTLWWQALAKMDRDYSLFIHLVDQDDRIWAQQDELLQYDDLPTSSWEVGEIAEGFYQLETDPHIPAGEYTVKLGIYYWETGERLPVWDERGERLSGDSVLLGTIGVSQ